MRIRSLKKYVLRKKHKDRKSLEKFGWEWQKQIARNKLNYEIEWFGIPIIQTPADMILMQELIFKIQPDFIIDVGIAHGGSSIYYASLLELLGKGTVVGVDIEIRKHNREVIESHPFFKRIKLIEGNSVSTRTIKKIKNIVNSKRTLVCLDSNHTKKHVLRELEAYKDFVGKGFYIVVFDTNTSELAKEGILDKNYIDNGPMEAIQEFLKNNNDFRIDKRFNKLYSTFTMNGFLKRV